VPRCKHNAVVKVKVHSPLMIIIRATGASKKMKRKRERDSIRGSLTRQKRRGALRCTFHGIDLIDSPRRRLATTRWRSGGDGGGGGGEPRRERVLTYDRGSQVWEPKLGHEEGQRGDALWVARAMERMMMIEIGTNHRETNMQESYFEKSTSPKLLSLVSRNTVSILMDLCTVTLERTRDCYLHDVHTSAIFLLHVFTAFEHWFLHDCFYLNTYLAEQLPRERKCSYPRNRDSTNSRLYLSLGKLISNFQLTYESYNSPECLVQIFSSFFQLDCTHNCVLSNKDNHYSRL